MYNQFYFVNPYNMIVPTYEIYPFLNNCGYPLYSSNSISTFQNINNSQVLEQIKIQEQTPVQKIKEQQNEGLISIKRKSLPKYKYPKKNVESNVINQCFSFLTTKAKSYEITLKVLKSQEKLNAFYAILKQGKRKNVKYMGRTVLQEFLVIQQDHPIYMIHKKLKPRITLKLSEIRKTLRILTCYFLKNMITTTILTSSKLDKDTIKEHLHRAREIYLYLNQKPSLFL